LKLIENAIREYCRAAASADPELNKQMAAHLMACLDRAIARAKQ